MAMRPPLDMRRRSSGRGVGLPITSSLHPVGPSPDDKRGLGISGGGVGGASGVSSVDHVKSPGELTVFVDKLLVDLEAKFEVMSAEVLERMTQMSNRIDNLEHSISEIISTNIDDSPLHTTSTSNLITSPNPGSPQQQKHASSRLSVTSTGSGRDRSRSPPIGSGGGGGGRRTSGGGLFARQSLGDVGEAMEGDEVSMTEGDSTIRMEKS